MTVVNGKLNALSSVSNGAAETIAYDSYYFSSEDDYEGAFSVYMWDGLVYSRIKYKADSTTDGSRVRAILAF